MPRIERNRKIDNFIKIAFQRIRDTMRLLTSTSADTFSEEDKSQLDFQFQALSAYEDRVVSEFRTLQIEKSPHLPQYSEFINLLLKSLRKQLII